MNKKQTADVQKAVELLEEAKDLLTPIQEAEQEAYDNLSEKAQEGSKGEALKERADALESAVDSIDDAVNSANESIGE